MLCCCSSAVTYKYCHTAHQRSVLHFCVYFDRAGHFITSNCISELMIFMCICIYVCVMWHTPAPRFIVYIHPNTTVIVYIITFYSMFYAFDAIMFYCTLSEMTRIKMINQYECFAAVAMLLLTSTVTPHINVCQGKMETSRWDLYKLCYTS